MPIALTNATFIDRDAASIRTGTILVTEGDDGSMEFVDSASRGAEVLDCDGRIVTPSFAIGHHHIYSGLARGMPMPATPPANFVEILEQIWWRLDKALDLDMVRACAQAVAIDALKCGVTFIIDHHASPTCPAGSLFTIAEALDEIGLSHLLCYELSDRDGADSRDAGLQETQDYLNERQGLVGLHASFTVSEPLLEFAVDLSRKHDSGLHIHVAEDGADQDFCLENHNCRVVERLHGAGVLESSQTILAHCIHLNDAERNLIANSDVWVAQQSESNQNNAVGALDARAFSNQVMIGTDGMHSDALGAARAAYLMAQREEGGMSPRQAHDRLRSVHRYLETNKFTGDGANNLVILNYDPPTPITIDNWPAHLMYGVTRSHVESVIAAGELALDGGVCTMIDEEETLAGCREQAVRLWERL